MPGSLYLILPNIRSCHNVGAMIRSADACAVTKIFLVGYTPQPPRPEINKVSLGAEKSVPWEHCRYLRPLLKELKNEGVSVVALEKSKTSRSIFRTAFGAPLALVVGNEVEGVRPEILALCDQTVHIPMYGKKESLNVSVAAGIALATIREALGGP